ncbi:Nucleoside-diphosphate-sugar epimerase [Salinimicrobium catena]|uniref:Nucleoside-diphosphate-sugar epimerase n=1 Tax=Salinimicrobium catena TaxID=390640 RepID=A0A1H5NCS8_9FLAO|nr:NAD-dependent epimerase/dehydratase family protein [Salinimicrobium catena]SDL42866.1 Nucleoside-diphosphate-sugar epimerase [Salinimicrobium catena]SEE99270.1 Nucleoside-diphosphate-sugar epimerase [Salinimicrobium catena]
MKILVTGAAGFIGSHAAEKLHQEGLEVIGADNFSGYYDVALKERNAEVLRDKGIPVHKIDLREVQEYEALEPDFDFIIHFAAQPGISASSSFQDYFSNNVLATQNLLEFARKNKDLKHFFNIATSSIYGLEATFPETIAPKPASWYGVTKLTGEQLVLAESRSGKLKASSLRLFSVYGPRERPEKLYTKLIACAFKDEKFPIFKGSEKHLRSFTYVWDIVDGIYKAVERYQDLDGEIINLGAEEEHKTGEGIALVEELLGKKIQLEVVPRRAGDQYRTLANIQKAKKILGYEPKTSFREGLQKQITWYMENFL